MKRVFIILFFGLFSSFLSGQGINVTGTQDLNYLVNDVLIQSNCVDVKNSAAFGAKEAGLNFFSYGEFDASNSNSFDFENDGPNKGIIITSGDVSRAGANNGELSNGGNAQNWIGDDDLEVAIPSVDENGNKVGYLNASFIEFTFTPRTDRLKFTYIMASEEFDGTFPCEYADSFAFLLKKSSEPDSAYKNLAVLKDSENNNNLVSVTNVHGKVEGSCDAVNEDKFFGQDLSLIYHSRTKPLQVDTNVEKDIEYKIKLVIADYRDGDYDSAVFIQAGSFDVGLDFGEDLKIATGNAGCKDSSIELSPEVSPIAGSVYNWFKDGNPLPEKTTTYSVVEDGYYELVITNPSNTCTYQGDIDIEFAESPIANSINDDTLCVSGTSGSFDNLDLTVYTDSVLSGQDTNVFGVSYHLSSSDANNKLKAYPSSGGSYQVENPITVWVRVENTKNPQCYDVSSFKLTTYLKPSANDLSDFKSCDSGAGTGNFQDGLDSFDMNDFDTQILNGQDKAEFEVLYFEDVAQTKPISKTVNYQNSSNPFDVYVKVVNKDETDCFDTSSFRITVSEVPEIKVYNDMSFCDSDNKNDGFLETNLVDLLEGNALGSQNKSLFEVLYYESDPSKGGSPIANPSTYTNTTAYSQDIWIKIQNKSNVDCNDVEKITFKISDVPTVNSSFSVAPRCDGDDGDSNTSDGILNDWLFSDYDTSILDDQSSTDYDVLYFWDSSRTQLIDKNKKVANNIANKQPVYYTISNRDNSKCTAQGGFDLIIQKLPEVKSLIEYRQCDWDDLPVSGSIILNLEEAARDKEVAFGDLNTKLSFYDDNPELNPSGANLISDFENYDATDNSSTVYIQVQNEAGCSRVSKFNIATIAAGIDPDLTYSIGPKCSGEKEGFTVFDLKSRDNDFLKGVSDPGVTLHYYRTIEDAYIQTNEITNPSAYENESQYTFFDTADNVYKQNLFLRAEYLNGDCYGLIDGGGTGALVLEVYPKPSFEYNEVEEICLNQLPYPLTITNFDSTYKFEWFDEEDVVLGSGNTLEINKGGIYKVQATDGEGCISEIYSIKVEESEKATLNDNNVEVEVFKEYSNITVLNDNNALGIGDYEFILDDMYGIYSQNTIFENVEPGDHTLYVRDRNGCGIASLDISVLGFPKFFTPNGDGYNDVWEIKGSTYKQESAVQIFDRYGRLVAEIFPNQAGWDGTSFGTPLIADDYWFKAILNNNQEFVGHFSLKR